MTSTTAEDVIKAAAAVAKDAAEGKIDPAALDQAVADECRELFGTVVGEGSLWLLHIDVARQVLAIGGLSADELSEHLAVARSRAGEPVSNARPPVDPLPAESSASGTLSPEIGLLEPELSTAPETEPQPEPAPAGNAKGECGCGDTKPAMVELPDGRRIHRRHIIARGRELPTDDGLREF